MTIWKALAGSSDCQEWLANGADRKQHARRKIWCVLKVAVFGCKENLAEEKIQLSQNRWNNHEGRD